MSGFITVNELSFWNCEPFFPGSGKTAAFLIPILSRIFEEGPPPLPDVRNLNCVELACYQLLLFMFDLLNLYPCLVFHTFIMLSFELYLKIVFLNNKVPLQWTSLFIIAIILYYYLLFGYFINMAACFSKTKFNPFLSPCRKICIVLKWYCLTYTRLGSSLAESSSQ